MPPNTVKVDRSTKFGNPFPVGEKLWAECGILIEPPLAVALFKTYLPFRNQLVATIKKELRGKNLACWCKIGAPCHGDVLLEIANR